MTSGIRMNESIRPLRDFTWKGDATVPQMPLYEKPGTEGDAVEIRNLQEMDLEEGL